MKDVQLKLLTDSITALNHSLQEIKSEDSILILKNKESIITSNEMISYLNSVIAAHSSLFTVLGIFLTGLALLLPILTYIFGIRPAEKALKNLKRKSIQFWEKQQANEIDEAILYLNSDLFFERDFSKDVLQKHYYYEYSDSQLHNLFTVLTKKDFNPYLFEPIIDILLKRRNNYADKYLNGNFLHNTQASYWMTKVIIYFNRNGMDNYWDSLKKLILKSADPMSSYERACDGMNSYAKEFLNALLNKEDIIDNIPENDLVQYGSLESYAKNWNIEEEIKNTKLFKRMDILKKKGENVEGIRL